MVCRPRRKHPWRRRIRRAIQGLGVHDAQARHARRLPGLCATRTLRHAPHRQNHVAPSNGGRGNRRSRTTGSVARPRCESGRFLASWPFVVAANLIRDPVGSAPLLGGAGVGAGNPPPPAAPSAPPSAVGVASAVTSRNPLRLLHPRPVEPARIRHSAPRPRATLSAVADCNIALASSPDDIYAYIIRGLARIDEHDYTGALLDGNRAIKLASNEEAAYMLRGRASVYLELYEPGIQDLTRVLRVRPSADDYCIRA